MNNKIILGIIGVIIVAGVAVLAFRSGNTPQVVNNGGVYCSSDGTLTDTMPIQSHRSYCIKSNADATSFAPNSPTIFKYSIIDDQGNILKDLDVVHEKLMHFIVVRKDLANFQHVHPEFEPTTGEFTLSNLTLPTDGEYRLFADFTPTASQTDPNGDKLPVTIYQDVRVGSLANYKPQPIGSTEKSKKFDGYQITLIPNSASIVSGSAIGFDFEIKKDGKLVTNLEKYLGALGHTVVLRDGDLQFIHAHATQKLTDPQTGKVHFAITFPEAGSYKLFSQFQNEGKIITSNFVVNVLEGQGGDAGATGGGMMTH